MIDGNIVRILHRIKKNPLDIEHLVEAEHQAGLLDLLVSQVDNQTFDLKTEFNSQYRLIKAAMTNIGDIQTKEDLDILKEAQKFLSFILRNEEKITDIQAVKDFKEAVLRVLDEESPELRDRVIRRLGE